MSNFAAMKGINNEILRIAIPNIISNITVPLMGIVSTAIAGHYDSNSVRTIGALAIGVTIFNFLYWNCSFIRMGTSGLTAQAYGAGNHKECVNILARAISASIIMGLLMLVVQYPLGEFSLWAMNGNQMTADYYYTRIWAVPAGVILFGFNGWFTGMQNAVIPMIIAIIVNITHIAFSLWFAIELDMGIKGIAYASIIAQYLGVALAIVSTIIFYGKYLRSIEWVEVLQVKALREFFNVNVNIMLRTVCLVAVFTFFTGISARMENNTILTVNTLLLEFFTLFSYMSDGFGYAAEALTGKYIGQKNRSQLRKSINYSISWGVLLALLFVGVYAIWWRDILYLFVDSTTADAAKIVSVAGDYIGWVIAMPVATIMAFIIDGIVVGATQTRIMRNSMFIATIGYFATFAALYPTMGNNALWLAFVIFMILRGSIQYVMTDRLRSIYKDI